MFDGLSATRRLTTPDRRRIGRWRGTGPRRPWIHAAALVLLVATGWPFGGGSALTTGVSAQEALRELELAEERMAESVAPTEPDRPTAAHPRIDRRDTLVASLTIFVLAIFLGFELITKVPPTLHTPLMSGSNAISGITIVGAILATGVATESWWVSLWGMLAIMLATINAVGGFAVTHRMLAMFRRK